MSSACEISENDKKIEDTISKILASSAKPGTIVTGRQNCVEKFKEEHQAAYEAYGEPGPSLMQRVNFHNAAYPKMYDELDKRRSIMQITTIKAERLRNFHPDCAACAKLISLRELILQDLRPKCERKRSVKVKRCGMVKPRKPRVRASRGAPSPPAPRRGRGRGRRPAARTMSQVNRGCQCISYIYVTNKQNGTSDDFYPEINLDRIKNESRPKRKLSVSTYNSDLSLGREPMV